MPVGIRILGQKPEKNFVRHYYDNQIIGVNELRGTLKVEELRKLLPDGEKLCSFIFFEDHVNFIATQNGIELAGLILQRDTIVGMKSNLVYKMSFKDLTLTFEVFHHKNHS